MPPPLVVEFTKMNGAGNDFVVLDNRFYYFSDAELAALARLLSPRRTRIGADGLLAFASPDDPAHDYRMLYYNADGSRGTMCGNGARCLARFARGAGITSEEMVFESDAGLYRALVPEDRAAPVRLYVQRPQHFRRDVPLSGTTEPSGYHYLWPGTEHVVRFVDEAAAARVAEEGAAVRHDPALAPAGANVNFVEVLDAGTHGTDARLRVRTFEKGVEAETLACGTGAIASSIVAHLLGRVAATRVAVQMPGGTLVVGFRATADGGVDDVYLEGPAEVVFRGTFELDPQTLLEPGAADEGA